MSKQLSFEGSFWSLLGGLDFGALRYANVALFVLTWVVAADVWRTRHIEERWGSLAV